MVSRWSLLSLGTLFVGCHLITIGDKEIGAGPLEGAGGVAGGQPACSTPRDCGAETGCHTRTCDDGVCGVLTVEAGTPCADDSGEVCNAQGQCVPCLTHDDCDSEAYCSDEACWPKATTGESCAGEHSCLSGSCVTGVCCDVACDGTCEACAQSLTGVADGTCAVALAATSPLGSCEQAEQCDGCGRCEPVQQQRSALYGDVGDNQLMTTIGLVPCGGVVVGGSFNGTLSFGGVHQLTAFADSYGDAWVAKLDATHAHQWSRRFGGGNNQRLADLHVDSVGDVVLVGDFLGSVSFDGGSTTLVTDGTISWQIYVVKLDGDGNHKFSTAFGGTSSQHGQAVVVDSSDNIILGGQYLGVLDFGGGNMINAGSLSGYIAKLDANAGFRWQTEFIGNPMRPRALEVDSTDAVWVGGFFNGAVDFKDGNAAVTASGRDGYVMRLARETGATELVLHVGGAGEQTVLTLAVDAADNVFVAGEFENTISVAGGPTQSAGVGKGMFVTKIDAAGTHQWTTSFASEAVTPYGAAVGPNGQLVVVGSYRGAVSFGGDRFLHEGDADGFVLELDNADGSHRFSRVFGDDQEQFAFTVRVDASNRIIAGGAVQGVVDFGDGPLEASGGRDAFLLKWTP